MSIGSNPQTRHIIKKVTSMTWFKIVDGDISDQTFVLPDDSDGLLIVSPATLRNIHIIGGKTQLVIRAPCVIDNLTNEDFGADAILVCSSNVTIKNSIGHLPVERVPYHVRHPDWIQVVCIDENLRPDIDGVIENISIDNCKLYAPHEPEKSRRGVQGIVGFDCEVRNLKITNTKVYSDIDQHGVSFIKPVGAKIENCKIKSINSDKKPGIIFENRKGTGEGYGNVVKNNETMMLLTNNTELIDNKLIKNEVTTMNVFNVEQEYPHLKSLPKGIPRGYRNNNPGNIKDFGIGWQGLITKKDALPFQEYEFTLKTGDRMCVFKNPESGIRAIVMDLLYKQRNYRDCKSIRGIMERYAPAGKENPHQEQYIWHIANKVGVSDKAVVSVKDYKTVLNFVTAIIEFENGTNIDVPYSKNIIDKGISDAGIAMPGEEKVGGVKNTTNSNGIRKGTATVAGTVLAGGAKIANDNGVFETNDTSTVLSQLTELATSNDVEQMSELISENKEMLKGLVDPSYTWYDYGIFLMLALIAYAAIDWVLDRRLTNMLGIK